MSDELEAISTQNLIKISLQREDDTGRWLAIDELARRGLKDETLLPFLFKAMRNDKAIVVRYHPYGTYMAVQRILESQERRAIALLLEEMDGWSAEEQKDAISPWAGHHRVEEGLDELTSKFNWHPKSCPRS